MAETQSPSLADDIHDEASRLGVGLTTEQGLRIASFLELIASWNPRIRLVGSADLDVLVRVHLADALALARAIIEHPTAGAGLRLLDVGSGAGWPGFALGLIMPSARISLCEVSEKRVSFLHEANRRLGLSMEVLALRAQDLERSGRRFPNVVSRATFEPGSWRKIGGSLCEPGGQLWSLWTEAQEKAFPEEELYRFRYHLRDGRSRVITARLVP